jgi:uncharacterized membrane-anchored protein YhcB (DUF1043 family)
MTLPEWAVITILAVIGTIIWWGILRFIHINDTVSISLKDIVDSLNKINGRLGKTEIRLELHEKQDDERYDNINKDYDYMQELIERRINQ